MKLYHLAYLVLLFPMAGRVVREMAEAQEETHGANEESVTKNLENPSICSLPIQYPLKSNPAVKEILMQRIGAVSILVQYGDSY